VFACRNCGSVFDSVKLRCSSVQSVPIAGDGEGLIDGDWVSEDALLSKPAPVSEYRVAVDVIGAASDSVVNKGSNAVRAVKESAVDDGTSYTEGSWVTAAGVARDDGAPY
jgi:hypothetical protein